MLHILHHGSERNAYIIPSNKEVYHGTQIITSHEQRGYHENLAKKASI